MTDIKQEIFSQDSTLFAVLDENEISDVVSLKEQVQHQEQLIAENKQQLDGLAIVVDRHQARNEQQFVNINTKIVDIQFKLSDYDEAFKEINESLVDNQRDIKYLTESVSSIDQSISRIEDNMNDLEMDNITIKSDISGLQNSVRYLASALDEQSDKITNVESNVKDLQDQIVRVSSDLSQRLDEQMKDISNLQVQIQDNSPVVSPTKQYTFRWTSTGTNPQQFYQNVTFPDSLRFGTQTNSLDGSVTITPLSTSWLINGMRVRVGTIFKANISYRSATGIGYVGNNTDTIVF